MLCVARNLRSEQEETLNGCLIQYSNPSCIERTMLPPVLDSIRNIKDYGPKFVLLSYDENSFRVQEGHVTFENDVPCFASTKYYCRLEVEHFSEQNERILRLASKLGKVKSNDFIPVLTEKMCNFVSKGKVKDADQLWVAGLIVSRAKVTHISLACLRGSISTGETDETMFISEKDKSSNWPYRNIFYAWWPSPKPASLGKWLTYLSDKNIGFFGKQWEAECVPFVEGYYRVALKGAEVGKSSFSNKYEYIFNDGISELQEGYFDYPYEPTNEEYSSGFVKEKERVRLSVSVPLALTLPETKEIDGWGWEGYVSSSYIYLVPGDIKGTELVGPVRSPTSQAFLTKHGVTGRDLKRDKVLKKLVFLASKEARLNGEVVSQRGCKIISEKSLQSQEPSSEENPTIQDNGSPKQTEESLLPENVPEIQTYQVEEEAPVQESEQMKDANEELSKKKRSLPNLQTTINNEESTSLSAPENQEKRSGKVPSSDSSKATELKQSTGNLSRKGEKINVCKATQSTETSERKGSEKDRRERIELKEATKQRTDSGHPVANVRKRHSREESGSSAPKRKKARKSKQK